MDDGDTENMSRFIVLIAALWLTACAHQEVKIYDNAGAPNATVHYKGPGDLFTQHYVWLEVSTAGQNCKMNYLGEHEVKVAGDRVHLPVGQIVEVQVALGAEPVFGNSYSQKSLLYRFHVRPKVSYVFAIEDRGRSQGFQVYDGGGHEIPFISAASCAVALP